jgi:phage repressor protein C with HTH and peptisase S24 domain
MLTHGQIWAGIDALAARLGVSPSALARRAGLDATSFNRSKRRSSDHPPRPRWPSTESLAKLLQATGVEFADFAELAAARGARRRGAPLIGMAQAGQGGFFDDAGYPVGEGWDEIALPDDLEGVYALEIVGDSMQPVYRHGDRVIVRPSAEAPARGDRVVVRTTAGEVMAKEVGRITGSRLELRSLNPDYPPLTLQRSEVAWIARILWASQ